MPSKIRSKKQEQTAASAASTTGVTSEYSIPASILREQEDVPQHSEAIVNWISTKLEDVNADLTKHVQNRDVTVFLGNTRAGKSTVVKYLSGAELESIYVNSRSAQKEQDTTKVVEVEGGEWLSIERIKNGVKDLFTRSAKDTKGAKLIIIESDTSTSSIGVGARSCTTVPKPFAAHTDLGLGTKVKLLWDMPGFDDSRGVHQDIFNAFCIKEVLTHAKSVKFVLVSDINELCNENVNLFRNILSELSAMFGEIDIEHVLGKMSLIITKASSHKTDHEDVKVWLENVLTTSIDRNSEILVKHFIDTPHHVGFFHKPTGPRKINCHNDDDDSSIMHIDGHDTLVHALHALSAIDHEHLVNIKPPIDPKSHAFLLNEYIKFRDMKDFEMLANYYDHLLIGKDDDFQFKGEDGKIEEWLTAKQTSVFEVRDNVGTAKNQHNLWNMIAKLVPGSPLLAKAKFIRFIDDQNLGKEKLSDVFAKEVHKSIGTIEQKLKLFNAKIESQYWRIKIKECEQTKSVTVVQLADEEKSLDSLKEHRQKVEKDYKEAKLKTAQAQAAKNAAEVKLGEVQKSHDQQNAKCKKLTEDLKNATQDVSIAKVSVANAKAVMDNISPGWDAVKGGGIGATIGATVGGIVGGAIGFFAGGVGAVPGAAWGASIGATLFGTTGAYALYESAKKVLDQATKTLKIKNEEYEKVKMSLENIKNLLDKASNAFSIASGELDDAKNKEEAAVQALKSFQILENTHDEDANKEEIDWQKQQKKVADLNKKLRQIEETLSEYKVNKTQCDSNVKSIKSALQALGAIVQTFFVTNVVYDNPLLGHNEILKKFCQLYGSKAVSNLIDLTSDLDKDDVATICASSHALESFEMLMGIGHHTVDTL